MQDKDLSLWKREVADLLENAKWALGLLLQLVLLLWSQVHLLQLPKNMSRDETYV